LHAGWGIAICIAAAQRDGMALNIKLCMEAINKIGGRYSRLFNLMKTVSWGGQKYT